MNEEQTEERIQVIYNEVCRKIRQDTLEEVLRCLPKVITPNVEPPPNKLSQNQIFAGGQTNMLLRVRENIDSIISRPTPLT